MKKRICREKIYITLNYEMVALDNRLFNAIWDIDCEIT